jgi:Matrixin
VQISRFFTCKLLITTSTKSALLKEKCMRDQCKQKTLLLTVTLCAGFAYGAESNQAVDQYPIAIAHPDQIFIEQLATRMFQSLPSEHQDQIAQLDGIGSDGYAHECGSESEHVHPPEIPADLPSDITATQYLELIVSDELASRLTQEQWNILNTIAASLDSGKQLPHLCFSPDTDREYAFAVNQLLEFPFQIRFQQTSRWTSTATDGGGLNQGMPTTLTYSFVPDGTTVTNLGIGLGSGNSQLFAWLDGIYGSQANWQPLFEQVFDRWAELINVTYVFEPNDDGVNTNTASGQLGVRGDVRIAAFNFQNDGNGGVLAYNNFPNDGDMIFDAFDTFYNNTFSNSIRFRNIAAHEHGHGLGMLHVCPVQQTKLMEPFISTAFDGPQLDDILNGIRHYGDVEEPNDNAAQATDLGTIPIGGFDVLSNLGVDDNNDVDFFKVTVTERARITFAVSPQADQYDQGPQTQACNTGTSTDYNSIHNLRITVLDGSGTTVGTFNDLGVGEIETAIFDAETSGDYFFIVDGATNINNVQRYELTVLVADVPFLVPLIETEAPESVDPGAPTEFDLTIDPREDTIVPGSELLFTSINGGAFQSSELISNGGNSYTASIPSANCDDTVEFYLSVEGEIGGEINFPEEGESAPLSALVGDVIVAFDDNFQTNQGWSISGAVPNQAAGLWQRGTPNGDGSRGDPSVDADNSGACYLTGNGGPGSNTDVDNGDTILTSPSFDVSDNPEATISYYRWFHNSFGDNANVETFQVEISDDNGNSWEDLETVAGNSSESNGGWFFKTFRIADFVNTTDQVRVRFIAKDDVGAVIEAGVDGVSVSGLSCEDVVNDCPADLTGDGNLNFFDISEFLSLFGARDPLADFTGEGSFNFFDISEFLAQFGAGCP